MLLKVQRFHLWQVQQTQITTRDQPLNFIIMSLNVVNLPKAAHLSSKKVCNTKSIILKKILILTLIMVMEVVEVIDSLDDVLQSFSNPSNFGSKKTVEVINVYSRKALKCNGSSATHTKRNKVTKSVEK